MTHGRGGDGPIFVKDGVVHCHAEISPGAAQISLWCVTVWLAGLIMAVIYMNSISKSRLEETLLWHSSMSPLTVYGGPKRQGRTLLMRLQTIQPQSQMLRTLRVADAVFLAFAA